MSEARGFVYNIQMGSKNPQVPAELADLLRGYDPEKYSINKTLATNTEANRSQPSNKAIETHVIQLNQ